MSRRSLIRPVCWNKKADSEMNVLPVVFICISYFAIGWISTTDILRLCRGAETPVLQFQCYCDSCGAVIPMVEQIPYYSYLRRGGRCRYCGAKIPLSTLLLEFVVFLPMIVLSALVSFRPVGVLLSFLYYELLKLGFLIVKGRRESRFFSQFLQSIGMNLFCFALIAFMTLFV